jgi:hypothetical protein
MHDDVGGEEGEVMDRACPGLRRHREILEKVSHKRLARNVRRR